MLSNVSIDNVHRYSAVTLLIELTQLSAGSSAMSGGSLWLPNSHLMAAAGVRDSADEALAYLKAITKGEVPEEKLRTYAETAPVMLKYMSERAGLRMQSML